ncbi:RNA polymerase sigma factor (sigma-70 family) [Paenibacillus cellulosilyticus]|uniref:RNA polymerase sigma factor (Sigma-70 family) n=1 Tax=Paenibacillus cellulosilyticus TaxID=375489 RepID=A0A2V2YPF2_9BACL|nr:RNA polymerase sigma factor [Paenibacillus cellulosilyticus]PWV97903.1 RNA polymerase sigma factor (sigma-70 family) [Paenibacillus cellulosilyticus]QKS46928.1 RNA polymerase sigma factor [Paenibacillus cellulosilyticus]
MHVVTEAAAWGSVEDELDNEGAAAELKDEQLVELARTGDREAFGELVRRHRARALGVASTITRDGQLAEDIVQEALVSAFLRIETLMEPSRFRYWLERIVRNQAMMKLRRSGPGGRASTFSEIAHRLGKLTEEEWNDCSLLDRMLFRIVERHGEVPYNETDPQARLMRKEMFEGLYELLLCLNAKERAVFEAHVFRQLSPIEISDALGMSVGAVHTSISRSRKKVQRERIRVYFRGYAEEKKQAGRPTRRVLAPPVRL